MRRVATSAILLLAVAASPAWSAPPCQDSDGDGYYGEAGCGPPRDCNDANPAIHPGAAEVCDGYDNDCNGALDDDPGCDNSCSEPDVLGALLPLTEDLTEQTALVWTGTEYAVAWTTWGGQLYLVRIDSSGNRVGPDVPVTGAGDFIRRPSLVWTGSQYGIAWTDRRDGSDEIYFARFDPTGAKIGSDMQVTSFDGASDDPSLVWTGTEFGIAWDTWEAPADYGTYFARLDASGNKIGTDVPVPDADSSARAPDLVWTGSEYGVAWADDRITSIGPEIFFARLDASGNKIGADVLLTSDPDPSTGASLVWTGSEYGLAWEDHEIPGILFARFDAAGSRIGPDVPLANATWGLSLVWTGNEYGLFWQDRDSNLVYHAHLARVDAMGNPIGNDVLLTELCDVDVHGVWTGNGYGLVGKCEFARVACDCTDSDLDGFTACQDCDDQNPSVYPNAPELCDGLNNNCLDPLWPDPPDHEDTDGDGFTPCAGDCDDAASNVFPGAPQLCDGVNTDCDDPAWPAIPEDETDSDGDSLSECQGDCDDTNPNVNLLAVEVCNQIDDDCNQLVDEDALGVDTDHDGVRNACDNCELDLNPSQADLDGNGVGDRCDLTDGLIYLWFDEPAYVRWQTEINFATWNSYRGDLEVLLRDGALAYTQDPARVPLASKSCDLADPWIADADPPPGSAVFFLTTGNDVETGAENGLGEDSFGVERLNRLPCP